MDDVYDEGAFAGKVYHPPFILPVLQAVRDEGAASIRKEGVYSNDELHLTCLFDELVRAGLTDIQFTPWKYHLDRVIYDDLVFRITKIAVLGQVQDRDIIVGIDATQVKPDELVNDAQFRRWSA